MLELELRWHLICFCVRGHHSNGIAKCVLLVIFEDLKPFLSIIGGKHFPVFSRQDSSGIQGCVEIHYGQIQANSNQESLTFLNIVPAPRSSFFGGMGGSVEVQICETWYLCCFFLLFFFYWNQILDALHFNKIFSSEFRCSNTPDLLYSICKCVSATVFMSHLFLCVSLWSRS